MNLTTRSKAIIGGAAASLGLLALVASPSLADNHTRQPRTSHGAEMQMTPEQMREMHTQMQQMMTRCNSMMSGMQGMMSNNHSSSRMGTQNHPTDSVRMQKATAASRS
jgi:cysteine synthase